MSLNDRNILISDLADYIGVSVAFVTPLVNDHPNQANSPDLVTVPNMWKWMFGHREGTPEEHKYFYSFCFPYLFDQANFASQFNPNCANAVTYMRGRCLDYGCGIGTVTVFMQSLPSVESVDAIDINCVCRDFLSWRCVRHGLVKVNTLYETNTPSGCRAPHLALNGPYDFIYARDVLEHVHNRLEVTKALIDSLAPGGVLCEATPIHKYDDSIGKENVALRDYDLWDLLVERGFKLIEEQLTGGLSSGTTKCWRKDVNS